MKILSVVGARPNFIKIAPIINKLNINNINNKLVHTGQHYDENMSKIFFDQLNLPSPDYFLGVGSGSHANQTAKIMIEFEKICLDYRPNLVIVVGDVNSTLACAIAAKKINILVAHVESGLRSFDDKMPEEINRVIVDRISDFLFVTEQSGIDNLINEGICKNKIFFVGNCMIDTLIKYKNKINNLNFLKKYNLECNKYALVTLHRPSNVDDFIKLSEFVKLFNKIDKKIQVVFPIHPRTKSLLYKINIELNKNILLLKPLPYIQFLTLVKNCFVMISDSGGIQEETTFLNKQCITVRDNTERPITVSNGTNHLVGTNTKNIYKIFNQILKGEVKKGDIPPKWDGLSSHRIVQIIKEEINANSIS